MDITSDDENIENAAFEIADDDLFEQSLSFVNKADTDASFEQSPDTETDEHTNATNSHENPVWANNCASINNISLSMQIESNG